MRHNKKKMSLHLIALCIFRHFLHIHMSLLHQAKVQLSIHRVNCASTNLAVRVTLIQVKVLFFHVHTTEVRSLSRRRSGGCYSRDRSVLPVCQLYDASNRCSVRLYSYHGVCVWPVRPHVLSRTQTHTCSGPLYQVHSLSLPAGKHLGGVKLDEFFFFFPRTAGSHQSTRD